MRPSARRACRAKPVAINAGHAKRGREQTSSSAFPRAKRCSEHCRSSAPARFAVARVPAIEIVALAFTPKRRRYDAVVAASDKAFLADTSVDRASPLYVVGARTARAAEAHGWRLAAPPAPDSRRLVEMLNRTISRGAPVLYLTGRDRSLTIEAALAARDNAGIGRGLCGRSAAKLASVRDPRARGVRIRAALFASVSRARRRTREGGGCGRAVPPHHAHLLVERRRQSHSLRPALFASESRRGPMRRRCLRH